MWGQQAAEPRPRMQVWSQTWSRSPAASRPARLRQVASGPPGLKAGRPFLSLAPLGRSDKSLRTVMVWLGLEGPLGTGSLPWPVRPRAFRPASVGPGLGSGPLSRQPAAHPLASEQTPKGLGLAGSLGTPGSRFALSVSAGPACLPLSTSERNFLQSRLFGGGGSPPSRAAGATREGVPSLPPVSFLGQAGSVDGVCLRRRGVKVARYRSGSLLPSWQAAGDAEHSPRDSEGHSPQEVVRKPDFYPAGPSGGSSGLWDSWFWFIARDTGNHGVGVDLRLAEQLCGGG